MIAGKDKELKLLDKASTEFAGKQLAPEREANDKYPFGPFFDTVLQKAHELEFFHVMLPEDLGGIGHGMAGLCIVLSNICREDASLGGILFTHTAACELMIAAGGQDRVRTIASESDDIRKFLIACPVFNNPSEIAHLARAELKDGKWVINGSLEYVVLGGLAGHALIPAKTGNNDAAYSWFLIDSAADGVALSEPVMSLGLHACPAVDMTFHDAPAELVGSEGTGESAFFGMAAQMQLPVAAMSLGIMKGSFKEALDYSKGRFQGGRRILDWSEIRMMLADMVVKIKTGDMILSAACRNADENTPGWQANAAAAAVRIQADACDLTTDGIQILGGIGYMKDYGQEKRFRDAKHLQALLGLAPMKKLKLIEDMIR